MSSAALSPGRNGPGADHAPPPPRRKASRSESIVNLVKALNAAQAAMAPAQKDARNPHFGSSYADLASVWEAARGPLTGAGLAVTQTTEFDGRWLHLVTTLWHTSGEWLSGTLPVASDLANPQKTGAALTYMRRYGLQALISLPSEDDDGNAAAGVGRAAPRQAPARDEGREAVNKAFRPKQAAPPREDRRREPAGQHATAEEWPTLSARLLKEANDAWRTEQAVELNIPRDARTDLDTNVFRLTNALVTIASQTDMDGEVLVDLGKVTNAEDKRDREKVKACAEWLLRRHRDWTLGTVEDYLAGKRAERLAQINPDGGDPDGDYPPEPGSDG